MANNKAFSAKARESSLASIIGSHITDASELMNALDFIESPMGLGVNLYPVQRVLLKLSQGIPMDYRENIVPVYDAYGEELLYKLPETEYLKYVFDEGRCNIPDWKDAKETGYNEICVLVGRRGGKSQLVSAITAYRLYKLLSVRDPQTYYGLVSGSPIDVVLMAQDEDGAGRLFKKLREDVLRSPFFSTYLRSTSNNDLKFVTENDRTKRDPTPTILVNALACTTRAARGPSAIVLCLDEFGHFKSNSGANSSEVYDAATPSTLQFKNPDTGLKDSQIIIVTSPLKKVGKYYDIFRHGMDQGPTGSVLSFRCSTAEMNPNTPTGSLRDEEKKSPISFRYEFGGEFADSSESYVKSNTLDICVDNRENVNHFTYELIGRKYFWGFDLGMRRDASALSIAHWEFRDGKPSLIYDYIDRLMVGEGEYENETELRLEHILQWLDRMHKLLPCFKGVTDQHGGTMLVQLLKAYGIEGMELIHLSDQLNSRMYHSLKGLIDQRAARFPNNPLFITEVKLLEAEVVNKYRIKVQAPMEVGSHDDMADSAALVAMLAVEWAQGEGAHEMRDLVQSPQLAGQHQTMLAGHFNLDVQYASLSDLRLLERQAQVRKMQMGGAGTGLGIPSRQSKYNLASKRR
jgi:hypothetical protein